MPSNLLLLPLLAGFLFISRSNLLAYRTSQLPKDQLLLYAALAGVLFLLISRAICYALLQTDLGLRAAEGLHDVAAFPYIGTAIGTLVLALLAILISNFLVSEQVAGFWLYHRGQFDPLARMLWHSSVGVLPQPTCNGWQFNFHIAKRLFEELLRAMGWKNLILRPRLAWKLARTTLAEDGLELSGLQRDVSRAVMLWMKVLPGIPWAQLLTSALSPCG